MKSALARLLLLVAGAILVVHTSGREPVLSSQAEHSLSPLMMKKKKDVQTWASETRLNGSKSWCSQALRWLPMQDSHDDANVSLALPLSS